MQQLITILHIFIAFCVIILVLIQHGKGADMGAGFGSGASGTMFGSQGATPFLVKLTASLAMLFFVSSALLSFVVGRQTGPTNELPFMAAPMKSVPQIPVSSEVQQNTQKSDAVPAPVSVAPTSEKEQKEQPKQQKANKTKQNKE